MRIGIVGCGTAGPAAAILRARAGHEVTLYERAPALRPVGAGFVLQPTGLAVLARLGLADEVCARGARIEGLHARTRSGRALMTLDYEDLRPGLHALGLQRAALLDVLADAMRDAGVTLRCGVEMRGLERGSGATRLRDGEGALHGPFDWIAIADGARSALRGASGLPARVRAYPWGAAWAVLPDPERRLRGALVQGVDGARHMVGLLPSGRVGADPAEPPAASLFVSVHLERAPRGTAEDLARVRDEALRHLPEAAPLAEALMDPAQLQIASYLDVRMPRAIVPGLVVLGDAAHAMSPQLGQGANLALCDALAFADALAAESDADAIARRYHRARRAHLRFYLQATRWLTPLFQSDSRTLGRLRDLVFPALGALPPLRRQMLRAMAGVKRGWLRSSFPLPEVGTRPT